MLMAMRHVTKKCYNKFSRSIQNRELIYAITFLKKNNTKHTTSDKCTNSMEILDSSSVSSTLATQFSFVPGSKILHHQVTHHLAS